MNAPSPDTSPDPPGPSRKLVFGIKTYLSLMLAAVSTVSFLVSGMVLLRLPGAADHRGHPRSTDLGGPEPGPAHRADPGGPGDPVGPGRLLRCWRMLTSKTCSSFCPARPTKAVRFPPLYQLDKQRYRGARCRAVCSSMSGADRNSLGNDYLARAARDHHARECGTRLAAKTSPDQSLRQDAVGARVGEGALIGRSAASAYPVVIANIEGSGRGGGLASGQQGRSAGLTAKTAPGWAWSM